jgi:hypothetical protein
MKLIFCPKCQDVFKLIAEKVRHCECGHVWGFYAEDGLNAEISAEAVPLGFANTSFAYAMAYRPKSGSGKEFTAFVIPEECDTIHGEK